MNFLLSILLLSLVCLASCSDSAAPTIYQSRLLDGYELVPVDTLVFRNTDSVSIDDHNGFHKWQQHFLIEDMQRKCLWVLDEQFRLVKILGRQGKGPDEYAATVRPVPYGDSLYVFDCPSRKYIVYNKDFEYVRTGKYNPALMTTTQDILRIGNHFIIPAIIIDTAKKYTETDASYFARTKSVTVLNAQDCQTIEQSLFPWEQEFLRKDYRYYYGSVASSTCLAYDGRNGFFARHEGHYMLTHYDSTLNLVQTFGRKPRYYKEPLPDKEYKKPLSFESYIDFTSRVTCFTSCRFDTSSGLLYTAYIHGKNGVALQKDFSHEQWHLQIFNASYDCVFDDTIDGIFALASNGKVYATLRGDIDRFVVQVLELRERKKL